MGNEEFNIERLRDYAYASTTHYNYHRRHTATTPRERRGMQSERNHSQYSRVAHGSVRLHRCITREPPPQPWYRHTHVQILTPIEGMRYRLSCRLLALNNVESLTRGERLNGYHDTRLVTSLSTELRKRRSGISFFTTRFTYFDMHTQLLLGLPVYISRRCYYCVESPL